MNYTVYKHCLVWNKDTKDEKQLPPLEISSLLSDNYSHWMLRNCYDWDCGVETNFWEIIQDRHHDISELPSRVRNQIRRCLRNCDIKKISNKELVEHNGYMVYSDAFSRYRNVTQSILNREQWEQNILNSSDKEYWGVFVKEDNKLIAWSLNTIAQKSVSYSTLKAVPSEMNKHYPFYGLLYVMGEYYLNERGFEYVSDGWRSVTEHSNIQPFLEQKFLFRKAYCKMELHYAWWLKLIINILFPFRRFTLIPLSVRNLLKFEEINRNL